MITQKVALITGISGGLGQAMAQVFKREGYLIAGVSRTQPPFNIDLFIQADLTEPLAASRVMQELTGQFGRLDVLINNAGVGVYDPWEAVAEKDLRYEFELNFFSVIRLTGLLLPLLKEQQGKIINISSVAGKLYMPYMGAYSASKFALDAYSRSLRAELRDSKVSLMNVSPGRISTGFGGHTIGNVKSPPTFSKADPAVFAEKLYKKFKKGKEEWVFPGWYKLFLWFGRHFSKTYDKISVKKWKDAQKT